MSLGARPCAPSHSRRHLSQWGGASLWPLCAGLLGCTAAIRPVPQDSGVAVTAFVDVAVIPMDRERVLMDQTVLVQGGRITALGPVGGVPVPPTALRIDGRGKFLLPGLANMHTHILADSATVEHQLLLFVTQGVTTIRNMDFGTGGNPENVERILRFRGRAAAGMLLSPRIYTSGPWGPVEYYDRKAGAGHHLTLDSVAVYVAAYKAKGYDHLKIHDETRVIVDSVAAAAHRVGIPVVGHLPDGSIYPYTYALSAGYKSIEHLDGYGREDIGVPAGESDSTTLDTMPLPALTAAAVATRRAGVWNCPTEAIVEKVLTMPSFRANYDHTRVRGIYRPLRHRIIQALQAAGAGLLLGTDFVGSVQDELAALVQAGLTPYQALVTGTRNVAVYFGTLAESGTVAVGKRADLVLLEGNPLRDIEQSRRIAGVMLGGRWLTRADLDRHLAAQLPN